MSLHYEWTLSLKLRPETPGVFLDELRATTWGCPARRHVSRRCAGQIPRSRPGTTRTA
jgi:hypothetical protein